MPHNSTIYDECHTQSAMVLAMSLERAYHNDSNDKPKVMYKFQPRLSLLWIAMNRDKPLSIVKGTLFGTQTLIVEYCCSRLD